jgi:NADP-reducing hydrogenase subunit HndB
MAKICSLADLKKLREELKKTTGREGKTVINVSLATCSIASGGETAMDAMKDEVQKLALADVEFKKSGCMCYCFAEPTVEVTIPGREPVVFGNVDEARARQIVGTYVKNGELVEGVIPVNYQRAEY